jgi:hypothetical protein
MIWADQRLPSRLETRTMAECTNPPPAVDVALEVDDDGVDSAYGEET